MKKYLSKFIAALAVTLYLTGAAFATGSSSSPFALLQVANTWNAIQTWGNFAHVHTGAETHSGAETFSNASTNFSNGAQLGGVPAAAVLLSTQTASASATLDFNSVITSTYAHYKFVFFDVVTSAASSFNIALSANNGSSYCGCVTTQKAAITIGGATAPTFTGVTSASAGLLSTALAAGDRFNGWCDLTVGQNGSQGQATLSCVLSSYTDALHVWKTDIGYANNVGPLNAVRFLPSAGNYTSGKVYLYALRTS